MRIIAVDDEELALSNLLFAIRQIQPEADLTGFLNPREAFDYLAANGVDIAFLDIEMGELSGIALAKRCKELCPAVNIIFVTGYSQYTMDAFKVRASGYLMKPVRSDELQAELENLRHPPRASASKRIRIQTFGNFEVFVDDVPLKLPRAKCKECLAYLVDRKGAGVTYAQLSSVLWEGQPMGLNLQNSTYKIVSELIKALRAVNAQDIILKNHTDIAIDVKKVDCDYFAAIGGDMAWMNTFTGEYMANYSWAEFTLGELIGIQERNL